MHPDLDDIGGAKELAVLLLRKEKGHYENNRTLQTKEKRPVF